MKKTTLLSFVGAASILAFVMTGYREGPAGYGGYECTGAETGLGNPTGCMGGGCHATKATAAITVAVELDSTGGKPTKYYIGGHTYTVKITGTNTGTTSLPGWGFQMGCIKGTAAATTPTQEGTWGTPYPANTTYSASQPSYYVLGVVEQTKVLSPTSGTGGKGTTYVETFNWTAPAAGTGTISFWGVVNAVNNNGTQDAGDLWNTNNTGAIKEIVATGVNAVADNNEVKAYPNPFTSQATFELGTEVQNATFNLYDISGRQAKQFNFSGKQVTLERGTLANGIYFYNIVKEDNSVITGRIVVQ